MGVPWGYGPKTFDVPAGSDQILELRVPARGTIRSLTVQQVGGADPTTFELYDSEPAAKYLIGQASAEDIPGGDPGAHRILDQQSMSGVYHNAQLDLPYQNRDGSVTEHVRRLWMRINVSATGQTKFAISMLIDPPEFLS